MSAINNSHKTLMEIQETEILETGEKLFSNIKDSQKKLFSKKWWYGHLMQWTLSNPSFKTPLFRFVDVFPSLDKSTEDIPTFLKEYFSTKTGKLPPFISKGIPLLSPSLMKTFISKQMKEMSQLFIVGEHISSTLPVLEKIRKENSAFTLDLLGEATLSEQEAMTYQERYLQIINQLHEKTKNWKHNPLTDEDEKGNSIPKVNISVKISSLDSLVFTEAWKNSKQRIKNKLRVLFEKAIETNTFINIDMEQYEYKDLTLEVFKELVSEPTFRNYPYFGIVIQAYLQGSQKDIKDLCEFTKTHPSPITIRLVKGAYWDYELIHARQQNWPCPVYLNKWEADLNFETCVILILKAYPHLRLAIGSHNIRSITYAAYISQKLNLPKKAIEIQTLYGMATTIKDHLIQKDWRVRQYCPMGAPIPGMAYLVRRLLENTANESFLRSWQNKTQNIEEMLKAPGKHCTENQSTEKSTLLHLNDGKDKNKKVLKTNSKKIFKNTPLLDFSLSEHRQKFQKALEEWKKNLPLKVPLIINNKEYKSSTTFKRENPSCLSQIVALVSQAEKKDCDQAITQALQSFSSWSQCPVSQRSDLLYSLANKIEEKRYSLSALQVLEVGKSWKAADADVCEAIDFCRYYAGEILKWGTAQSTDSILGEDNHQHWQARGLALVIAPWNFPLAILTGMTAAALVTGNTVLVKPAEQSSAIAYEMMKLLMECGLPAGVVQFLPGTGEKTGAYLVEKPETELIAFTGSKEVGLAILEKANQVSSRHNRLKKCIIEMGGKNAIIVDNSADLDMAVAGVMESAFEFQGQKCSACSRVLIAESIKVLFTKRLVEALHSLTVGQAEKPEMRVGPVVNAAAMKKINSYIKEGKQSAQLISKELPCPKEGYFISPAIFNRVPPNSPLLKEEIFGPVLALIPFKNLDEALQIANNTEFALTGAFYSRSPSRIEKIKKEFQVGNLYINRNCTGALVKRHPFGGFKMSGLGHKTGGTDYLKQFMNPKVITENTVRRGFSPHLFTEEE